MGSDSEGRRKLLVGIGGFVVVVFVAWSIWSRIPPPQLKADEQVFTTVDALFTALTSRDSKRLDDCERRLKSYHEEGRTSDAVASTLDGIVKQAREGQWEPAARKLYTFMLGQRGETAGSQG